MITDALINFGALIGEFFIGILPAFSGLPSGLSSALNWMLGLMRGIADLLPMTTIMQIVLLTAAIEISLLGFRFVAWLLRSPAPKA